MSVLQRFQIFIHQNTGRRQRADRNTFHFLRIYFCLPDGFTDCSRNRTPVILRIMLCPTRPWRNQLICNIVRAVHFPILIHNNCLRAAGSHIYSHQKISHSLPPVSAPSLPGSYFCENKYAGDKSFRRFISGTSHFIPYYSAMWCNSYSTVFPSRRYAWYMSSYIFLFVSSG